MTPSSLREFFVASAGVAGALIGLLFVTITVAHERLTAEDADQGQRIRASAALTAFTNAFAISLFALVPGVGLGWTALVVSVLGVLFVAASFLSLVRVRQLRLRGLRDVIFLIALLVTFVFELVYGLQLISRAHNANAAETIAVLVVVCFLIGIARAWELIDGPSIGLTGELTAIARARRDAKGADEP